MTIGNLKDLQNWVKDRQKRKMVGLLTDKDVKVFWAVLTSPKESSTELLDATVRCCNLDN